MPVKETTERGLSLFEIDRDKLELIAFAEECTTDEERLAVANQIQSYVRLELRKVSGIAALLKYFKAQVAVAKAEEERAAKWRKRWEANYERLKNMVHGVMVALDLQKVEGATDRFRRQKNPVALEITDAAAIPEQYLKATVRMPFADWKRLVAAADSRGSAQFFTLIAGSFTVTSEVDTAALKAACSVKIKCAVCGGAGDLCPSGPSDAPMDSCIVCEGTGQVLATVPGAHLAHGEHLRIE